MWFPECPNGTIIVPYGTILVPCWYHNGTIMVPSIVVLTIWYNEGTVWYHMEKMSTVGKACYSKMFLGHHNQHFGQRQCLFSTTEISQTNIIFPRHFRLSKTLNSACKKNFFLIKNILSFVFFNLPSLLSPHGGFLVNPLLP